MTVYATGDVHGRAEYGSSRFAFTNWPLGRTLTRDDVVIVAGDFGFVWDGSNAEKYWLDWFEAMDHVLRRRKPREPPDAGRTAGAGVEQRPRS